MPAGQSSPPTGSTASALVGHFGRRSPVARRAVGTLYQLLTEAARAPTPPGWLAQSYQRTDCGAASDTSVSQPFALGRRFGLRDDSTDSGLLLLAIRTYYALVVKLLALQVAGDALAPHKERGVTPEADCPAGELHSRLADMEAGLPFSGLGLAGFLPDESLGWYLHVWNEMLAEDLHRLVHEVAHVRSDPGLGPEPLRDRLGELYQDLVPLAIRHRLGEYYTPDWLVEWLLDRIAYQGDPTWRLVDPACGSGTFLMQAIARLRGTAGESIPPAQLLAMITHNIAGFDLNPLAVLSARTNYLMAVVDLLPHRSGEVTLPAHLSDTILDAGEGTGTTGLSGEPRFHYVTGNPPWVNWRNLPSEYRRGTAPLWQKYGLFPHRGLTARLGGAGDDLSALMTFAVADRLLVPGGRLGFIVSRSLFQSYGAGRGFRRLAAGPDCPLRVLQVDEVTALRPFGETGVRPCLLILEKGAPTQYPVPFTVWRPRHADANSSSNHQPDSARLVEATEQLAEPIDRQDPASPWLTARPGILRALHRVLGRSPYRGRKGVTPNANAAYWLELLGSSPDGSLFVRNNATGHRSKVEPIQATIEPRYVFPLLRGRDVERWSARPSLHILVPHSEASQGRVVPEEALEREHAATLRYLRHFRTTLQERASTIDRQMMAHGPFYSMYGVGLYTFAPWKVVWREIAAGFTAAVAGPVDDPWLGGKTVIPDHKLIMVPCDTETEAHYLCALLNSSLVRCLVASYSLITQIGTHLLQHVAIPPFRSADETHLCLAALSQQAHRQVSTGIRDDLAIVQAEIDQLAAGLWGVTGDELEEIQESLAERGRR